MARIFSPPESIGSPLGCVGADRTPKRDGDLAVSGLCATRRSILTNVLYRVTAAHIEVVNVVHARPQNNETRRKLS
ncbi:TPA: hypothetical protein MHN43_27700 [Klebsiella pneumoniae]|jgi:hypothetical protein|nr:hypothetical protein [Klebsiella pneumoniae]OZJ56870.1 hypothetical protein CEO96_23135 [Klebsiella pneumoniae]OZR47434.1 hypothetical protein CIG43_22215 [Klebsiella pneumoniae]OZR80058.1 hypothetical protein CIG41_23650 [Klebsiella pneumoniae]PXG19729.1 hypothetical protein DMP41_18510 [Klebsiella pneumoniae]